MSTEQIYELFLQSAGICTDTRAELSNSIFFALKGDQFDGNSFVEDALKLGCRLAITDRKELKDRPGVIFVPSPLLLLQKLARYHRERVNPRLVAITGSNGKTTTKELMAAVLSRKYRVASTRGNLNNHIGVPLTLLSMKDEEVAVVEMGANHAGEIAELAAIALPEAGVITNVGKAHLEGFGSLQGVLDAKGELYDFLAAHEGKALVDGSDGLLLQKALDSGTNTLVIGPGGDLPVDAELIGQSPCLEVKLTLGEEVHLLNTGLVGSYNLQNMVLAAGVGLYFGVPSGEIASALATYRPLNQRSQLLEGNRNRVVLDSYNANPSSMREAIGSLLTYASSPTMLVLGDMAELGDASLKEHKELVEWIGSLEVDRVLLAGPNFYQVCEPSSSTSVFRERKELEQYLAKDPPEGYLVLVKGSRVMELEKLAPLLND
ncbi:MAG: UDP-N-acetylmuramoyl-tripeptide--D-alanyl-D-alanine ligase [Bacteroidia bacterium]|nr:MAG: UDP-N-acetylmuramoyl-tripeptide--D-alanyl-D-alanine ligase [Bacteroidia bacterium]